MDTFHPAPNGNTGIVPPRLPTAATVTHANGNTGIVPPRLLTAASVAHANGNTGIVPPTLPSVILIDWQ